MGFVLCALNVLWFAALVLSLVWNACGDSIKGRCVGAVLDASLGAEERGVETVEEAKALLVQRDATIAQRDRELAQREREMRREKAHYQDKIAEQDCRERTRVVTRTVTPTPHQSCISTYRPQQAAEITSLRTAKDKNKQITRSGSKGSARGGK